MTSTKLKYDLAANPASGTVGCTECKAQVPSIIILAKVFDGVKRGLCLACYAQEDPKYKSIYPGTVTPGEAPPTQMSDSKFNPFNPEYITAFRAMQEYHIKVADIKTLPVTGDEIRSQISRYLYLHGSRTVPCMPCRRAALMRQKENGWSVGLI